MCFCFCAAITTDFIFSLVFMWTTSSFSCHVVWTSSSQESFNPHLPQFWAAAHSIISLVLSHTLSVTHPYRNSKLLTGFMAQELLVYLQQNRSISYCDRPTNSPLNISQFFLWPAFVWAVCAGHSGCKMQFVFIKIPVLPALTTLYILTMCYKTDSHIQCNILTRQTYTL